MNDGELVRAFEACDPGLTLFSHEQHLRVATWYLAREPLGHAAERFQTSLRRFAESRAKPQLYHATISWGYLVLLAEKLGTIGANATFDEIKRRWPDLLDHRGGELRRIYSEAELQAPEARSMFLLPRRVPSRS